MACRTALIISPLFDSFSYGEDHPFKLHRFRLAQSLMDAYGLLGLPDSEVRGCSPADDRLVASVHDSSYLERLREFSASDTPRADFRFGLGDTDCPTFKGLYECASLGAGATFEAIRLIEEEGFDITFNMTGGWHHAHRSRASGFSYLNDAAIAMQWLVERGRRVAYIDIDAHHGDGVQEMFYGTDRVLTISLHESGIYFFPGTGFENETGTGKGSGYSVNLPLLAHTDDALLMKAFDEVAYPLLAAYDPDIIVAQIGADTFRTDPLTRMEITTHSYSYIMRKLKALKIPMALLGGGGYDLMNTARAWTVAWGIMNGVELQPQLPAVFAEQIRVLGYPNTMLFDAMHWSEEDDRNLALDAVERSIARIRETVFPVIIGKYGRTSGK